MQDYSPLLAGLGTQHESHESSPGVWTHTFTPIAPSSIDSLGLHYSMLNWQAFVKRMQYRYGVDIEPTWTFVYSGRVPACILKDQARTSRLQRRKQIERRQKRAMFRRRKRGIA